MADGRIWFNTKIDNTGVEKDLRDLENKIKKSQESIAKAENEKLPLVKQLDEAKKKLDAARNSLAGLKADLADTQIATKSQDPAEAAAATAALPEAQAMVAAQEREVEKLQKNWAAINGKVEDYNRKIQQANIDIDRNKVKAGELTAQLNSSGAKISAAFDKARGSANKFGKRMLEIAKGALVFNVVSAALRGVVNYMGKVLKSNAQYTAELAKLKGALLTAFQPIYEFVLPGVLAVMRVLTAIAQVVANVLSFLFGKTAKESANNAKALNAEANAIDGVGSAAKKAQKSLASFDEINTLNSTKTEDANVGGGGGGSSGVQANFSDFEKYKQELEGIAKIVEAIAVGLLAWKVSSMFLPGLSNISAAFGLLAAGIVLVVHALSEWISTGELSNEMCAVLVGGILAIGGALSLFTGSWIPLVIAAIVGFGIAAVERGDEIKVAFEKLDNWLKGVFETDWRELFGPVLGSIINGFLAGVKTVWNDIKKIFNGFIDFVSGVFSGDAEKAFRGFVTLISGILGTLLAKFKVPFNAIGTLIRNIAQKVLPDSWKAGINKVIAAVNKFILWLNDSLTFYIAPIKVAGITLYSGGNVSLVNIPQIPMLAKGAVIPPNAPFMAMLGDQKHGTNIEAPLSTIQEAVATVMQDNINAMMQGFEALLQENRQLRETVESIEVGDKVIADAVKRYNSKLAVVRGG